MIPSVIAPPAMYPGLLRPTAALHPSLQAAFPSPSSFMVDDLLRLGRPAAYLSRPVPTPSSSPPISTTHNIPMNHCLPERMTTTVARTHVSCNPKTSSATKDPTFLKFGVNAILAPSPKKGMYFFRQVKPMSLYFDECMQNMHVTSIENVRLDTCYRSV